MIYFRTILWKWYIIPMGTKLYSNELNSKWFAFAFGRDVYIEAKTGKFVDL